MAILGDSARIQDLAPATYSFLRTIAEGNTGITGLYWHDLLQKQCVQKTITVLGIADGVAQSEPRLLELFNHPRLIKVREAQWDADYPASMKMITFITDYYEGESIHAALTSGHRFSTKDALDITACILEGLAYLHATAGYVHRDIKPGNIMLDGSRSQGFVGDFGSAARMNLDSRSVSASGGTLLYRPPEFASGEVDERGDLYSTGMTTFEMLNGPFDYAALNQGALDRRAAEGRPTLGPSHLTPKPWVSPAVVGFVRKLMNPDPSRRFQTADEALRTLRGLRYVSWSQVGPSEWIGVWPPRERASRQRQLKVTVTPLTGRAQGQLELKSSWSRDGITWRGYARLTCRVGEDDVDALAGFFRTVESEAQSVPVR